MISNERMADLSSEMLLEWGKRDRKGTLFYSGEVYRRKHNLPSSIVYNLRGIFGAKLRGEI